MVGWVSLDLLLRGLFAKRQVIFLIRVALLYRSNLAEAREREFEFFLGFFKATALVKQGCLLLRL
jgi:hypothetical protein